jgi:hypothetical protein
VKKAFIKRSRTVYFIFGIGLLIGLAVLAIYFPDPGRTQEEVISPYITRYRERVRSGYHEGYEVKPRLSVSYDLMKDGFFEGNEVRPLKRTRDAFKAPGIMRDPFPVSPTGAEVRIRSRLPDAHAGIKFYQQSTCTECHSQQARNFHADRAGINCRQCHGAEPIPAINHYSSPMNPIRRHAYVCATCHEGANDLFATYIVHEPPPGALATKASFPAFFYANWFMVLLLAGTMAFFIPHSLMMFLQELMKKKGKTGLDILLPFMPHRFMETWRKRFSKKETPEK